MTTSASTRNSTTSRDATNEGHLARGEDRAAGDAELVIARLALELAACGNVVGFIMAAAGAHGLAVRLSPTHLAECPVSGFLASLVDRTQAEGSGAG